MLGGLSDRQRRLYNYYEYIQDDFWKISKWPQWLQSLALAGDVTGNKASNRQRYCLFSFWVSNGLSPQKAAAWLQLRDRIGTVLQYTHRMKVWNHAREMEELVNIGTFTYRTGMDMIIGRVTEGAKFEEPAK